MPIGTITTNEQWMTTNLNEYNTLSETMKSALSDFLILWSYFEFQVLNTNAKKIIDVIENNADKFSTLYKYEEAFSFARNRCIDDTDYSDFFAILNFRRNDNKKYVQTSLMNNNITIQSIASLLIIVYRLRNNMFHGLKWIYGFTGQEELFYYANIILKNVIEDMNN